jgi:hypothetical protein
MEVMVMHITPNYPFIMGCRHRKEQKFNVSTTNLNPSVSIDNVINLKSFSLDERHTHLFDNLD